MGTTLPRVTGCVDNFGHFTNLTFQCKFKFKSCLARYDHHYHICEESSNTMAWSENMDLTFAWRFLRTNTNLLFDGALQKICMIFTFRCADTILLQKWTTMDIWKSKIVWSGNIGCHVSQEDTCKLWVALYPTLLTRVVKYGFLSRVRKAW